MDIIQENNNIIIENICNFSLDQTLECGQCFRWENIENKYYGIVKNKKICVYEHNNKLIFEDTSLEDFNNLWRNYFDLDRDYSEIVEDLSRNNTIIKNILKEYYGIRILNQDPWETLCSFIISQNNNIPRIKKIVSSLCENFGEKIDEDNYSFPSPEIICKLTERDLDIIKAGFRNKYILSAAECVVNKTVDFDEIRRLKILKAEEILTKIKGVGPKISQCVLLYAFHRLNAFPIDVWINKIMHKYFRGETRKSFGKYAGVAQQYLYYYYSIILRKKQENTIEIFYFD